MAEATVETAKTAAQELKSRYAAETLNHRLSSEEIVGKRSVTHLLSSFRRVTHPAKSQANAGITSAANNSTERIASAWLIEPKAKSQTK